MNNSLKKSILVVFLFVFILSIGVIALSSFSASAQNNHTKNYKYFKSIVIQEGDSLWSIAKEYMGEEYREVEDYISELKSMNGLNCDIIHAGQYLTVAYYSDELK